MKPLPFRLALTALCLVVPAVGGCGPSTTSPSHDEHAPAAEDAAAWRGGQDAEAPLDATVLDATVSADTGASSPPVDAASDVAVACVSSQPNTLIHLPHDETPHGTYFEWWYWTGHLQDPGGHPYGFQVTFFEAIPTVGLSTASGTLAIFTVTDVDGAVFAQDYHFVPFGSYSTTGPLSLSIGGWSATGTDGTYTLSADMAGYAIDLTLTDTKRPAFHFGDGYYEYPTPYTGHNYYYSRSRMAVQGTLTIQSIPYQVDGMAWMDQQWGTPIEDPSTHQAILDYNWEWYQFQLDGGEEYMLYRVSVLGQPLATGGTHIARDCRVESLDASDFHIDPLGSWTSPHTGKTYAQGWSVALPKRGIAFTATPLLADQEIYKHNQANPLLASIAPVFWEGKVRVSGTGPTGPIGGLGYAEVVPAKNMGD